MAYTILSYKERVKIQTLLEQGKSINFIAKFLNRSKSTICNEIHRVSPYNCDIAHKQAQENLKRRGVKAKLTNTYNKAISYNVLVKKYSPEKIILELKYKLCHKTIYNWIEAGLLSVSLMDLPNKNIRRRRRKETRGKFAERVGTSIELRPLSINNREEIGHYEIDTIRHGKVRGEVLLTLVDRKSRHTIIVRLSNRTADETYKALAKLVKKYNIKSLTADHGSEFSCFEEFEKNYGVKWYFAHPYAPHERGTNENINRLIRRFIPKTTRIEDVSDEYIEFVMDTINNQPFKVLKGKTPLEVLSAEMECAS